MLVKCFSPNLKKIDTWTHLSPKPDPFRFFQYAGHMGTVPSRDNLNSESVNFRASRYFAGTGAAVSWLRLLQPLPLAVQTGSVF